MNPLLAPHIHVFVLFQDLCKKCVFIAVWNVRRASSPRLIKSTTYIAWTLRCRNHSNVSILRRSFWLEITTDTIWWPYIMKVRWTDHIQGYKQLLYCCAFKGTPISSCIFYFLSDLAHHKCPIYSKPFMQRNKMFKHIPTHNPKIRLPKKTEST